MVALGTLALRGEPEPAVPKVIGIYPVAASLSPLAPGYGAVWTADPIRGQILRIDPATRRVVKRIPVHAEAVVATGAGAVWALAGDLLYAGDKGPVRLLRIDPATNRIVARIPMRTPAGDCASRRSSCRSTRAWCGSSAPPGRCGSIPAATSPTASCRSASRRAAPSTEGDGVWVLTLDGRLRRLDAAPAGQWARRACARPAESHLFGGPAGTLTVIGDDTIALLDRPSGRDAVAQDAGRRDPLLRSRTTTCSGRSCPARPSSRDRLVRLDADSGRRRGQVALPEPGVSGMAKVGRDVWVATPGGRIVVVR